MAVWCFCVLCGSTTLCVCVGGGIWQSSRTLVGHEPHQPTTTWWCCEVVSFHHCPSFHVPLLCVCVWDETRVVMVTMVAPSHCIAINNTRTTCMSSIWPLTHLSAFFLAFWLLMGFKKVCVCGMVCGMATIGTSTPHLAHTHTPVRL